MRSIILTLITISMFGLLISFHMTHSPKSALALKVKSDFPQIWDYDVEYNNGNTTSAMFKAIRFKKDDLYENDLKEFIQLNSALAPYRVDAAYTLAKTGSREAGKYFNLIISTKIQFDRKTFSQQIDEKSKALNHMNELKLKPDSGSLDVLKTEIVKLINLKYPTLALRLAVPLIKSKPDFLDEKIKNALSQCISEKWNKVEPSLVKESGIQPDWNYIFSHQKTHNPPHRPLTPFFLEASDTKTKMDVLQKIQKSNDLQISYQNIVPLIAAAVGDEKASKKLLETLDEKQIVHVNYLYDDLPDNVLLKALDVDKQRKLDHKVLSELIKRGYKKQVDTFLDRNNAGHLEFRDGKIINYQQLFTYMPFANREIILDELWKYHKQYPTKLNIALEILDKSGFSFYEPVDIHPGAIDWMKKNPEKFAEAIKTVLENYSSPQRVEKDRKAGLGYHGFEYDDKDTAFRAMMLLPDEIFKRYFANVNPKIYTVSSFIVDKYFKADWQRIGDQGKFYIKYANKSV